MRRGLAADRKRRFESRPGFVQDGLLLVVVALRQHREAKIVDYFMHIDFQPHANVIRYSGAASSVTIILAGPGWDETTGVELAWLPDPD